MPEQVTFETQYVKRNGKLIYVRPAEDTLYRKFVDSLPEGYIVSGTFDAGALGKNSQLAHLHGNIRAIADETGSTFMDVKKEVKEESGFCIDGNCKSFGDMNTDELKTCIETSVRLGEFVGLNLR